MADKHFRFSATLQINSRAKGFVKKAPGATEESMRRVLRHAKKNAQDRVQKGQGPGPHPHNYPHEDTGELALSVQDAIWLQGFLTEGTIYTDSEYGTYLEVGWRTKQRNFYRYPWLKPAFLEALRFLPKLAAETFRSQMQDFTEERIAKDVELESWAAAAERWAKEMKALAANPPTHSPEIPPAYDAIVEHVRRRVMGGRNKGGRPKDNIELGEEMKLDRDRARRRDEAARRAREFDTDLVRRSRRSGEANRRSTIDPLKAAKRYEQEQARIQRQRDSEARKLHDQNAEQQRKARARQEAVQNMLRKANEDIRKAAQPNVQMPKPPKTPKVPSVKRPRKKK